MKLSNYYISAYGNDKDQESQKNERKKVKNLIDKFEKTPEIFGALALNYLSVEEQAKLVHFFLEECSQRQIIDNLKKTNTDVDFDFLQFEKPNISYSFCAVPDYSPLYVDNEILRIRQIIRAPQDDYGKLIDYLLDVNDQVFQALMNEYAIHKEAGIKFEWLPYVTNYIDFILNDILQFLVYPIMMYSPHIDPLKVIDKLSLKAQRLEKVFSETIGQRYEKIFSDRVLNADRVMQYFKFFMEHRNRLFENSDIYSVLIQEMEKYPELFSEVPGEFMAEKKLLTEEQIYSDEIKHIVLENSNVPNFKKKLDTVRKFINVLKKYGSRNCYDTCLQDIKVYFREIYMSKQTYHRQKASKIVENYLEQVRQMEGNDSTALPDFHKESQYIFIREKITRGYFREKNHSDVYAGKIELTNKLNTLLLKCYWLADSKSALEMLHKYNRELLSCYLEFYE